MAVFHNLLILLRGFRSFLLMILAGCNLNSDIGLLDQASANNQTPIIVTNNSLNITEGDGGILGTSAQILSTAYLNITDNEQDASNIVITITTASARGQLYNSNTSSVIPALGSFTMEDVINGFIEYRDTSPITVTDNGGTANDTFIFSVSDGIAPAITANVFQIITYSICIGKSTATDHTAFGVGSRSQPYTICTAEQLDSLSESTTDWDKFYTLRANLDMTTYSEANFNPIGNSTTQFTGGFDGHGNTISNLSLNSPATQYMGLFGWAYGSKSYVKNIIYTNFSITGSSFTGGLVGLAELATISNIDGTGTISSSSSNIGGHIGRLVGGKSIFLKFAGDVTGSDNVGGVIGQLFEYGIAENLIYAGGTVTTSSYGGGLIGESRESAFKNGYAINATVIGLGTDQNHTLGGGVGSATAVTPPANYFSKGNISGSTSALFTGRIGPVHGHTSSSNYYHSTEDTCSDIGTGGPCNALGTAIDTTGAGTPNYFYQKANPPLSSWDFISEWQEVANNYPEFTVNLLEEDWGECGDHLSKTPFAGGIGSIANPYLICTVQQLNTISTDLNFLNKHFKLMANLDLSGVPNFIPIGDAANPFSGTFDGQNFIISNMTINYPTTDNIGFFGVIASSIVHDVHLVNLNITGQNGTGGLVGSYIGNAMSQVFQSSVQGTINGQNQVGGIIGNAKWASFHSNFVNAVITGNNNVGGHIGLFDYGVQIRNSYALGSVSGISQVGGIVGTDAAGGSMVNLFTANNITGSGTNIGPVIGLLAVLPLTNSFYDDQKTCSGCDNTNGTNIDTSVSTDYFYLKTNAPLDSWDFNYIWSEVTNNYPNFK